MIAEAIDSGNYEKVNGKEHLTEFFNVQRATDMVYELIQQYVNAPTVKSVCEHLNCKEVTHAEKCLDCGEIFDQSH